MVKFKEQWVVATDAKEYHYLLYARIMNKLKSFLTCFRFRILTE